MRTALAFLLLVASPLLLECTTRICEVGNQNAKFDYVEGSCPVKLTPVPRQDPGDIYTECVIVHAWITADDLCKAPDIEIRSPEYKIHLPTRKSRKNCMKNKRNWMVICDSGTTQQSTPKNASFSLFELKHDCFKAKALQSVKVSYNTLSTRCSVSYQVPDPTPDFDLSVNLSSKSITITVQPGNIVRARLCYQTIKMHCNGKSNPLITIDPSQSRSAQLNISYLLPCLCVEAYYSHMDAKRHKKCPFQNQSIADVQDVWLSSNVELYESSLNWYPHCPTSDLPEKISASLCWRQHEHLCTPILNSTLDETDDGKILIYKTSSVDKHPQMCVQLSLQGSHNISCPFKADMSSWEVHIELGRQSVFVYLTSLVPALFSAQFCVLNDMECTPIGPVHELIMEGNTTETKLNVPPHFLADKPCVQVWQSDPALHGKRILCLEYTHYRCGIFAVAVLIFVITVALLTLCIHHLTKRGAAGWLYIQKPVLLVCSSEQSAHVSASCALATILQGELSATVHMALWAQSSQTQARAGVTDLGPLPWLYGQWELVHKAQGKVLIIWSPEAKKTYEKWKKERAIVDKSERKEEENSKTESRHAKIKVDVDHKLNGKLRKGKKERAHGKQDCIKLCEDWDTQKVPSTVTAPVFSAALACLDGALQQSKGQGIVIVYFEGLGQSRDIPNALRGVPRYCLPQDFRGLIQELAGMRQQTESGKCRWHCRPRLLSKVLLIWLARKLANRLQTLVPQMKANKRQGLTLPSSQKIISDETQSRLQLPLASNME